MCKKTHIDEWIKKMWYTLTTGVGEDVGTKKPSYTAGGNIN
jgi:hypothetical protein